MPSQKDGDLLLDRLRQRWGNEPGWILRPNKEYGFFLLYRRDSAPLGEVRELIEETFGFAYQTSFIIGTLTEPADES